MPISIASTVPSNDAPIEPASEIAIAVDDPDHALGEGTGVLCLFDDHQVEIVSLSGSFKAPYASSETTSQNSSIIRRTGGWRRPFVLFVIAPDVSPAQTASVAFDLLKTPQLNPFALAMAQARTRIAHIAVEGVPFEVIPGDRLLDDEPPTQQRWFEVAAEPQAALTQQFMAPRSRQARRRYRVRVRYDAQNDRQTIEDVIASDDDQIIGALEQGSFPVGVQLVQCVDARREDDRDGFSIRTLVFEVTYVVNDNPPE